MDQPKGYSLQLITISAQNQTLNKFSEFWKEHEGFNFLALVPNLVW